jgi:hypothetical protein
VRAARWHDVGVGVLFDYYSAGSDEAAAGVIDLPGGPGAAASGLVPAPAGLAFDVVPVKGIDPLVQMGTLEGLLTGRGYEAIVAGPRAGQILASKGGGERMVVTLTDELQAALASADERQLGSVAVPWCQTDEFFGQGDPELLAGWLRELAGLARRARDGGKRLYCWVCV